MKKRFFYTEEFSASSFCDDSCRRNLEDKYYPIVEVTNKFNRKNVSYQANKDLEVHNWFKFKEAFSKELVQILIRDFEINNNSTILDPFSGSGTTLLTAAEEGINSIGFDILPFSKLLINAKQNINNYELSELQSLINEFKKLNLPKGYDKKTNYLTITKDAYPDYNDKFLAYITQWIENSNYTEITKNLFLLSVISSLENSSYTTKKGQYLGWDSRSNKIIERNNQRIRKGLKTSRNVTVRKDIGNIQESILEDIQQKLEDIKTYRNSQNPTGNIDFKLQSCLFGLPKLKENSIDAVITSPPYCNRYDYTRTYALELAYLEMDNNSVKDLRQEQLSSTVENKSKLEKIEKSYHLIKKSYQFNEIIEIILKNRTLNEILEALNQRKTHGDLNNNGVIKMVKEYFTELTFIIYELFRICKPGAYVAMVNDNVRYGGEIIPVDFLLTDLAESIGFEPIKIYCIEQLKGNSSQQMKKFGKVNLRKSILIWKKPVISKSILTKT